MVIILGWSLQRGVTVFTNSLLYAEHVDCICPKTIVKLKSDHQDLFQRYQHSWLYKFNMIYIMNMIVTKLPNQCIMWLSTNGMRFWKRPSLVCSKSNEEKGTFQRCPNAQPWWDFMDPTGTHHIIHAIP